MTHTYRVVFNHGCTTKDFFLNYSFGRTKGISLYVNRKRAEVRFALTVQKTPEDIISFRLKLFRDAYRRLLLLHALRYNEQLEVSSIIIHIDENITQYDKSTAHFPFMFSMLGQSNLRLNEEWKNMDFINKMLSATKTTAIKDMSYSAAYSFLAGRNRAFLIDRFTNDWTSMNAVYNYIGYCYENHLKAELELEKRADIHNELCLVGKDAMGIEMMKGLLCPGVSYGNLDEKKKYTLFHRISSILNNAPKDDISVVYDLIRAAANKETELPSDTWIHELQSIATDVQTPLYMLLLLDLPYYLRCKYLHGEWATVLFSAYNEVEIGTLAFLCVFMEHFLNQTIPALFIDDRYTGADAYEIIVKQMLLKLKKNHIGSTDGKKPGSKKYQFYSQFEKLLKVRPEIQ